MLANMIRFRIMFSFIMLLAFCISQDMLQYTEMESPKSSSVDSVQFFFFKSSGNKEPHAVKNPKSLNVEDYDPRRKTVLIIHGFGDYYPGSYLIPALVQGYSSKRSRNIIAVDWGELAAAPYYLTAARNCYPVGARVAGFMSAMMAERNHSMRRTEVVGFSLGAHIAGVAASLLPQKPRRIIGLDPAELLFTDSPAEFVLDKTDAPLVEVVHTSGGYVGFRRPIGHRDFYPNGGTYPQPGCSGDVAGICSHRRAYQYFSEAIENKGRGFKATKCISMKDYLDGKCAKEPKLLMANRNYNTGLNGSFFLLTNSQKPYGVLQ